MHDSPMSAFCLFFLLPVFHNIVHNTAHMVIINISYSLLDGHVDGKHLTLPLRVKCMCMQRAGGVLDKACTKKTFKLMNANAVGGSRADVSFITAATDFHHADFHHAVIANRLISVILTVT